MGWLHEKAPGHEGYVVGLTRIDNASGWPRWRELGRAAGDEQPRAHLERIQVGCDCGWRSRVFEAPATAKWFPLVVELGDDAAEDACLRLWQRHVEHDLDDDDGAPGSSSGVTRRLYAARDV